MREQGSRAVGVTVVLAALACMLLPGAKAAPATQSEGEIMRLGMIGLDTSHVIAFTRYLNDPKNNTGCRVVAGYPGGSPDLPASRDRVQKFTEELRDKHGVEIVGSIEELCTKVDAVLLESVDGRPHLAQARPVIAARKPLFVDKPMAASLEDAVEIFRLAKEAGVLCWTSSSYRYGEGIAGARENQALGKIVGCDVFGPSSWAEFHPDLYLYGIHPVEALFTVMGTGCQSVRRVKAGATDMVVGTWKDGRIGTFRDLGTANAKLGSAALIYGSAGMATGKSAGYEPLIREIVKAFKTGQAPVPAEETIEILAFMSAADVSKAQDGAAVSVPELIEKAGKR